jgi:uncharacterized protein (UPF0335 family)
MDEAINIMEQIDESTAEQLKQAIEKIERLEQEKAEISEYIRDAFSEAKSHGFDVKIMRQVLKLRKMKKEEVVEQETLLDTYKMALGMI